MGWPATALLPSRLLWRPLSVQAACQGHVEQFTAVGEDTAGQLGCCVTLPAWPPPLAAALDHRRCPPPAGGLAQTCLMLSNCSSLSMSTTFTPGGRLQAPAALAAPSSPSRMALVRASQQHGMPQALVLDRGGFAAHGKSPPLAATSPPFPHAVWSIFIIYHYISNRLYSTTGLCIVVYSTRNSNRTRGTCVEGPRAFRAGEISAA